MLPKLGIECFERYSNQEKSLTTRLNQLLCSIWSHMQFKKNHGLRNRDPWQAMTKVYQGSLVLKILDCLPLFLVLDYFSGKH